ncbi:MAG: class I SAM-dependent methyltransferase [Anaerolineales bacterium]|nr:class I SAM-dependent methyltransferase [Anaerolineales bacterium]
MRFKEIPLPNEKRIAIRVTAEAERALRNGHPWLFESGITSESFNGRSGDLAVIFDRKKRFLAVGLFDPHSPIRVRVLQAGRSATIDANWLRGKIETAAALRDPIKQSQTNGYRLIHGENDGLPGLVVDRYADTLVVKLYTTAWIPHLRAVVAGLTAVCQPNNIVLRLSRHVEKLPQQLFGLRAGQSLWGEAVNVPVCFHENGLLFEADVVNGQKTGFFLDQRDNRARVEKLAAGKTILNVFAYTGGFSLYAARGGATAVTSLDISRPALDVADHHFMLNQDQPNVAAARHEIMLGDAFELLPQLQAEGKLFDLLILDPPAFAKRQSEVERALGAYGRLLRHGLGVLRPGGILVAASCSSRVSADEFFALMNKEALREKRPLREIERSSHALDHPIGFPEGAYLKCLFAAAQ